MKFPEFFEYIRAVPKEIDTMTTGRCCVPFGPLRKEASHRSEMVSQLLFGESCNILGAQDQWLRIICAQDGYEGWIQQMQVMAIDPDSGEEEGLVTEWTAEILFEGFPMRIPLGSSLPGLREGMLHWGQHRIAFNGARWLPNREGSDKRQIARMAMRFMNTPYLWGGRSVFGIDCSGLTQTLFKFFAVRLLRDAHQQAEQADGQQIDKEWLPGDLAFFHDTEGRIVHVGMLLNNQEIIHASGMVRVDRLDGEGIIHAQTGERTHFLSLVKRFF
jgi:hypothetical protein